MSILEYLFGAASFVPHGYCLLWRPDLVALHAISDGLIAAAYFAISISLYSISVRRKDIEHRWVLWLFAAFISLCGLTHLMGLITMWFPIYGAHGLVKLATAGVSVATAFAFWPIASQVVTWPSPVELTASNEKLRRALAANEQSLAEVQTLFENGPDAIVMVDSDGRITRSNKRAAEIFGYATDKLQGMHVENLMPKRFRTDHVKARQDYGKEAVQQRMGNSTREVMGLRADGTEFPIEANLGPISHGDAPQIVCASIRDVSQEQKVRDQLAHAQRIDAIGRMTSGIAHDFNNILSAILANLQLIERQGPFDKPAVSECVDGALKATRRGAELTRRLLTFTRLQQSRISTTRIRDMTRDLRQLIKLAVPSSTEIVIEDSAEDLAIKCDIAELEATLLNLVANARDAIGDRASGRIEVRARGLDYSQADAAQPRSGIKGEFVELSVSDNGCGMDQQTSKDATQPFFTTKPAGAGTGLGLSIVSAFVNRANGHLAIASTPNEGTTVTILLPRANTDEPTTELAPGPDLRADDTDRALGILVIDDDNDVLPSTTRLLQSLGHQAVGAHNREEAFAALQTGLPIDVILCDISLSDHEDGIKLASELTDHYPHLRVILFTGFSTDVEGMQEGLPGPILKKPLEYEKIAATLHQVINAKD